jgi:hypothetical protein
MGEGWWSAQSAALGLDGGSFGETCKAALRLYGLATDEVWRLLEEHQRAVVGRARELSGRRVPG